ncbi:MAG TPA: hypothetical protein VMT68_14180 [Caulobacteraceae bacterium]|nr:hypothetical protein [Caulobacteraceae bacterium]
MNDAARRRLASPPAAPDDFTRDELRRLARAERKLAGPDRAQQAGGHREIEEIGRRRAERIETQSLAARLAETSSLALARGELVRSETVRQAVPVVDEHGARVTKHGLPVYRHETHARVRIASRGGLQLAFERGDLDGGALKAEALYETGKAYRWAFETASALTTPPRQMAPISARAPLRASAGPQDAVFAAGEFLRLFRRDLSPPEIAALDRICGLDQTIRAAAAQLKADPRTLRRRLVEALTAAARSRKAEAERGRLSP